MYSNSKEESTILRSWANVDEITLIKEVVTKGEHIDLCIDYISAKKQITPFESKKLINKIIDKYVHRLLNEKLLLKAESILENLKRNFKSIFYQLYFESTDSTLKSIILDYLQKKQNENEEFQLEYENYKFYWNVIKLIENENTKLEYQDEFKDLESLTKLSETQFNNLLLELYFMTDSIDILKKIPKSLIWKHLIKESKYDDIILWLVESKQLLNSPEISKAYSNDGNDNKYIFSIENYAIRNFYINNALKTRFMKYFYFEISNEMIQYGCENIKNPSDVIRDFFIYHGYVFKDEQLNLGKTLNRIFRTQSFHNNDKLIKSLPEYLYEMKIYQLFLEDFLKEPSFTKISYLKEEDMSILKFIQCLNRKYVANNESYLKLSKLSSNFLQNCKNFRLNFIAYLAEFLADEKTYNSMKDIQNHFSCSIINCYQNRFYLDVFDEIKCISVNNIFLKYVNMDIQEIFKNQFLNGLPTFSNCDAKGKLGKFKNPNYLHYLNQQRSGHALYNFLLDQLRNYPQISTSQMIGAVEVCTENALNLFQNIDNFVHFISFIEMIDFNSQALRSFVRLIVSNNIESIKTIDLKSIIEVSEVTFFKNLNSGDENFPIDEYSNLMRISQSYFQSRTYPQIFLKYLAQQNNWWKLLLFVQYFSIPMQEFVQICNNFQNNIMGEHFLRPLSTSNKFKRTLSISRSNKVDSISALNSGCPLGCDTMTSSVSSNYTSELHNLPISSNEDIQFLNNISNNSKDLFSLLILSWNHISANWIDSYTKYLEIIQDKLQYPLSINLMKNSIKFKRSILTVLTTLVDCDDINIDWYWITWLSIEIDNFKLIEISRNLKNISMKIIEYCVRKGYIKSLHRSFKIFCKWKKLLNLTKFLQDTADLKFLDDSITALRLYYVAWSNNEINLPFSNCEEFTKDQIMNFTVKIFILHLKYNFNSHSSQQSFLNLITNSGISDLTFFVDFNILKTVHNLISTTLINLDFEQLLNIHNKDNLYDEVIANLMKDKEFNKAIEISILLNLSITDIVYQKWIENFNQKKFRFKFYDIEIEKYILSPNFLVNFYLDVAKESQCYLKYKLMKKSLDIIKHNHLFPNETFNRDQIEYDMILCYLKCDDLIDLEIYYSEYYEEILIKDNLVLYKSFMELKELAGIEDLTTDIKFKLSGQMEIKFCDLINKLLDAGDIIEALRLQAMFEYPTIDLRYLVFCMALAEGLTSIYNLSDVERSMFISMEKNAKIRFDKRILATPTTTTKHDNRLENISLMDFEEIPSKEKQEILNVIQGFASSLKHGIIFGQRIVMAYRVAMYLDKEYVDVLRTKDTLLLLKSVAQEDCLKKLVVVNDIFISTRVPAEEIADYLAYEISKAIIRPVFYILTVDQSSAAIRVETRVWDYDINREFHLILELCPNKTILGKALLEYGDMLKVYRKYQDNKIYDHSKTFQRLTKIIEKYGLPQESSDETKIKTISTKILQVLSHKKQNTIYVELLIKAHECFTQECSMEGLADILNRAKIFNTILTNAKSWKLIVRCLTGIGRYREMFYCFETLLKNDQFEFLLGQFDEEKIKGFKHAILSYIHDHCPQNQKLFEIVAVHFLMYNDLARMWERDANLLISTLNTIDDNSLKNIKKTIIKCTIDTLTTLNKALESLVQATENYLLDNKLNLACKCGNLSELIAMQIDFVSNNITGDCPYFLKIQSRDEFKEYVNLELNVPQTIILKNSYPEFDINWSESILSQYILFENAEYFSEFCKYMELTDTIIENVIKGFQMQFNVIHLTAKMELHLLNLVELIQSVSLKYKLSSLLGLKKIVQKIINSDNNYFLKDTNYGRHQL